MSTLRRLPRVARAATALAAGALVGCAEPGAGRRLGDDLGTFRVEASESANGCGAGVLGATPEFTYEVELAADTGEIFWDGQAAGSLDSELRFDVLTSIVVDGEDLGTQPLCRIERRDRVRGTLSESEAGIDGFTATLSYEFRTARDAICEDFDRELAGLPLLPCQISYELVGERTRAPITDEQDTEAQEADEQDRPTD